MKALSALSILLKELERLATNYRVGVSHENPDAVLNTALQWRLLKSPIFCPLLICGWEGLVDNVVDGKEGKEVEDGGSEGGSEEQDQMLPMSIPLDHGFKGRERSKCIRQRTRRRCVWFL